MSEKKFVVETVEITDCDTDVSRIVKVITDKEECYSYEDLCDIAVLLNEQQSTIQSLQREIEETEISIKLFEDDIATKDKKIGEQQVIIDRLQKYNDVLHDENLFNTMKMLEFMKEKGVFDEFYERIKKEVFGDE